MKKIVIGIIIGAFLTIGFQALAEYIIKPNTYPIYVNGIKQEVEAFNINDRTYLPLRKIGDILNTKVNFNEKEEIVIGEEQNTTNNPVEKEEYIQAIDGLRARLYTDDKYYVAQRDIEAKYKGNWTFKIKEDGTYLIYWRYNNQDVIFFDNYPQSQIYDNGVDLEWYNTVLQPWLAREGWRQ